LSSPTTVTSGSGQGGSKASTATIAVSQSDECTQTDLLLADGLAPWLGRREVPAPAALDAALASYADSQNEMLSAWFELVAYLYDGRLAALMEAGRAWMSSPNVLPGSRLLKQRAQDHIARHVGLMASGAATTSRYSRGLLRFLSRHALRGVDPAGLAIR